MDEPNRDGMTADDVTQWIADMKEAGLARSAAACGRLLGINPMAMGKLQKKGADTRTALSCRALLHRLPPYTSATRILPPPKGEHGPADGVSN